MIKIGKNQFKKSTQNFSLFHIPGQTTKIFKTTNGCWVVSFQNGRKSWLW